jgi:hypothetical protein
MMRVKNLNDELGSGIGVYLDGKFFEVRNKDHLQARIYGENNDCSSVVLVKYEDHEKVYTLFELLTDRINHLFEINVRNGREDFIRYLDRGFEKRFRSGKIKINPSHRNPGELRRYAHRRAAKYGILTEVIGWAGIMATINQNPKTAAVIAGFYFVFGDVIFGLVVPWLADLGGFTSPFFQIGAYPAKRRLFKRYISLDKSLLTYFGKRGERLRKLEKEFKETADVEKKSFLNQRLRKENKKLTKYWEPAALSFKKSEELKGIIIGFRGRYENAFAFCNYLINGTEPKEEDLDVWRIEIEPLEKSSEETDFDRVWEEKEPKKEENEG